MIAWVSELASATAEKRDNLLSFSLPNDFLKSVSLPWQFHFSPLSLFIYLFLLCVNSAKILLKLLMALSQPEICCHMLLRPGPRTADTLSNRSDTANYWQIIPSQNDSKTRSGAMSPNPPRRARGDWRLSDSIKSLAQSCPRPAMH